MSNGPTVVTLYLLPSPNPQLLPQLRKLPPGTRVLSVEHWMADIKPDEHIVVDTERGGFHVYLWKHRRSVAIDCSCSFVAEIIASACEVSHFADSRGSVEGQA